MAVSHVHSCLPRRKQRAMELPFPSLKGVSDQSYARGGNEIERMRGSEHLNMNNYREDFMERNTIK